MSGGILSATGTDACYKEHTGSTAEVVQVRALIIALIFDRIISLFWCLRQLSITLEVLGKAITIMACYSTPLHCTYTVQDVSTCWFLLSVFLGSPHTITLTVHLPLHGTPSEISLTMANRHRTYNLTQIQCPHCSKICKSSSGLTQHINYCHISTDVFDIFSRHSPHPVPAPRTSPFAQDSQDYSPPSDSPANSLEIDPDELRKAGHREYHPTMTGIYLSLFVG